MENKMEKKSLSILGVLCIIIFILYLIKVLKDGPYITNFGKDVSIRRHIINIKKTNQDLDWISEKRDINNGNRT